MMGSENYKIISTEDMVQAFSKERIPHEPQGWQKEFRNALRSALSELKPMENLCLTASYCGTETGSYDLENILFYNIGSASFRQIATYRLFAENRFHQGTKTINEESEFSHKYAYKICNAVNLADFWESHTLAAEWEVLSIPASFSNNKAVDYWQALRGNPGKVHSYHKIPDSPFGVKIKLSVPKTKTLNLVSVIKPMLDGVICAFHSADKRLQEESSLIASHIGVPEQQILCDSNDILGTCRFIYPYRDSVKCNPQDNRCFAFEIAVEHNDDEDCCFSGHIYEFSY